MLKLQIDQSQPGICFHKSICAALNGWNDMMWMTFEWRLNDMWRAGSWEGELEELGHRTRHLLHGIPVKLPCPGLSWDQLRTCHTSHINSYQVISSHISSNLIACRQGTRFMTCVSSFLTVLTLHVWLHASVWHETDRLQKPTAAFCSWYFSCKVFAGLLLAHVGPLAHTLAWAFSTDMEETGCTKSVSAIRSCFPQGNKLEYRFSIDSLSILSTGLNISDMQGGSRVIVISDGTFFEKVKPMIRVFCFAEDQVHPVCSDNMLAFQGIHFAMGLVASKTNIFPIEAFNQEFKGSIPKTRVHLFRVQSTDSVHWHKHLHKFVTILPSVGIQRLVLRNVSTKRWLLWVELRLVFHWNVYRFRRGLHSHLRLGYKGSPVMVVGIIIGEFSTFSLLAFNAPKSALSGKSRKKKSLCSHAKEATEDRSGIGHTSWFQKQSLS